MIEKPNSRRRGLQALLRFRLSGLLFLTLLVAFVLRFGIGWYYESTKQQQAASEIRGMGGDVGYAYLYQNRPRDHETPPPQPPGPAWLRDRIGIDFFDQVVRISFWEAGLPKDSRLASIVDLKHVDTIHSFEGPIDASAVEYLEKLPNLRQLHVQRYAFDTDESLVKLKSLNHLRELFVIAECPTGRFTDHGVRQLRFAAWKNLVVLGIASPEMTSDSIREFAKAPALRTLFLGCHSRIDDAGIPLFAKMQHLTELELSGTQMTPEGVRQLRLQMPNCKIDFDPLRLR